MFSASHPAARAVSSPHRSSCYCGHETFVGHPAGAGGLAPWQVGRVTAHIEANIGSNIRGTDLAGIVRLSTSHFYRAFRESFGETPLAYITRRRMRRAQLIMLSSAKPLSQVALDCGMYDQAHFTRVFRRIIGINPGVWRRQFPTVCANADEDGLRAAESSAGFSAP